MISTMLGCWANADAVRITPKKTAHGLMAIMIFCSEARWSRGDYHPRRQTPRKPMIKTLIALSLGLPVLSSAISAQSDPDPLAPNQLVYVANNTIYHDARRPSHVLLPVVPREDAPGLKFDEK
jgi:hypothetical protein